eukprot:gene11144-18763_t
MEELEEAVQELWAALQANSDESAEFGCTHLEAALGDMGEEEASICAEILFKGEECLLAFVSAYLELEPAVSDMGEEEASIYAEILFK